MNNEIKKLTPFKMCIIDNFPFIEADFDAITNYQLLCKVVEYLNKLIANNNEMAKAYNYIVNYFNNLDVQDEINNKLDEMAESGELEQIIEQYLNSSAVWGFDTVADMKSATNLINGSNARTLGYYSKNDGGSALYKIRTITNEDVIDEGGIISLNDETLVAELIPADYISIYQFGAKGDGETDDSSTIQNAINYSVNHNFIEIKGNINKTSVSNETIKLHAYNKVSDLNLNVLSNSLTNNFMISINSSNVNTWDVEYPNSTRGCLKNIQLSNSEQISGINGIFNASNCLYENIKTNKLDVSFKSIDSYLDEVEINRIEIAQKIGINYAINLGYLGDACSLDTAHMHATIGTPNFIEGFRGHNAILLKNIIANGNLKIDGGNVSIENIHSESGTITISNAIVKISNGYLYHTDPNIEISNSFVVLNQIEFAYFSNRYDYSDTTDIDVNITDSDVEINECYKSIKANNINERITSFVKTNIDSQPTYNPNKRYYKKVKPNEIKCNTKSETKSVAYSQLSDKVKWYEETGTYYYKVVPIIDIDRKLRIGYYEADANIELTNGDKGFRFASANDGMYRVYRGTSADNYNKYVDIAINGGSIQDDGYFCNGYKWSSRTAGDIDTMSNVPSGTIVEYNGDNIKVFRPSTPSTGTWNIGDIVYNSTSGDNVDTGWICIESGTPGTWRTL